MSGWKKSGGGLGGSNRGGTASRARIVCAAASVLACGIASSSRASVIADYTIASGSSVASNVAANIASTSAFTATGFTPASGNVGFSSGTGGGSAYVRDLATPTSFSSGEYWSFTITPSAGYQLQGVTLTFDYGDLFATSQDITSQSFEVASSATNNSYGTNLWSTAVPYASGSVVFTPTPTIDLSAYSPVTGALTFDIYEWYTPYQSASGSYNDVQYLNNFVVGGTVIAAPEPTAAALVALSVTGLCMRRRRAGGSSDA